MIASSSDHFNFCAKYSQLSSIPSSPERRFKSVSPCRRLFEELSTNQNSPGFVVSNGNLATPNSSFYNNNNNNNNFLNFDNLDFIVSKDEKGIRPSSSGLETTKQQPQPQSLQQQQSDNFIVEGLTDILYSSYQRRRSISSSSSNCNNNINSNNLNLLSSPFMDDLGFLSNPARNPENSNMKKNPLVLFENDFEGSDLLMSSPMKIKEIPMKPCSITKSQMHWTSKNCNNVPRRTMSEFSIFSKNVQVSENGLIHHLPCFDSPHDAIKRISPDTLTALLEGKFNNNNGMYERIFIIDCRYPYEYEGGHIPTAINVNTPDEIDKLLMEEPKGNTLIVFHCEFSSERAPRMALHVRNLDRQLNKSNYPSLFYPEMYILDGGYKNFWQQHGDKCEPPHAYLQMRNPQYRDQLRHHQKMKHAFKSGCHLSQHSAIKRLPPKSRKPRSKSLNIANARKFFNDLINNKEVESENEIEEVEEEDLSFNNENLSFNNENLSQQTTNQQTSNHMFPSYTIPMVNSFSSIFASELDIPSEMDME